MRVLMDLRNGLARGAGLWAVVLLLSGQPAVWGQRFGGDPVQDLRLAVQIPVRDPQNPDELAFRRAHVQRRIAAIRSIGDLRRALSLDVWKDEDRDLGPIDAPLRRVLEHRLTQELRAVLQRGDNTSRQAAVALIAEIGVGIRETAQLREVGKEQVVVPQRTGYGRTFGPDLIRLTRSNSSTLSAAAARALGRINPEPEPAAAALGDLLRSGNAQERLAAADALNSMIRTVSLLAKGRSPYGVEASREDVVEVGRFAVPMAARGVNDSDGEVRRMSLEAIGTGAQALADLIVSPKQVTELPPAGRKLSEDERRDVEAYRKDVLDEQKNLLPLTTVLSRQTGVVGGALNDTVPTVRLQAARTLQDIGFIRLRLDRRLRSMPPLPGESRLPASAPSYAAGDGALLVVAFAQAAPKQPAADLLGPALGQDVLALAARVADSDVRVRLAAIDALEMIPDELAPAAPALVRALSDPDKFVRWAAARVLGKAAAVAEGLQPPVVVNTAVPALTLLLCDPDLDVRVLGAMFALQRYGVYASPALQALTAAVNKGDAESRIGAINTLVTIGSDAASAVPALAQALNVSGLASDARVRRTAAEALGRFGPAARSAVDALRRALYDPDEDVRRLAADSLLSIVPLPPVK